MSEENQNQEQENEEVKTFTQEQVNEMIEEKTSGLKSKVDELLGETKEAKRLAKEREAAEQTAKDEAARKNGDLETIENSWNSKLKTREAELMAEIEQRDKLLLGSKTQASLTELSADFLDPEIGKRLLQNSVDTRLVDGQTRTFYKDGDFETDNISAFKDYLGAQTSFQSLLKGVNMQGGGATEGKGSSGAGIPKTLKECYTNGKIDPAKERAFYEWQEKQLSQ